MKVFYTAKDYFGQTKSGEVEVKNERELASGLRLQGFILTSFKEFNSSEKKKVKINFSDRFFGISLTDKLMFTRNLSVMISSGLPLSQSLKNLSLQTDKKRFSQTLNNIFNEIQAGKTFADSLSKYPAVFDELFVNMIRVGETSGNLEEILEILSLQLEKEHELTSKVKGALVYPAVIIVAMIGIGIVMLTFILPKLMGVFSDMSVELPASTKFVIGLSKVLTNHSISIIVGTVFLGIFLKVFLTTSSGKKTLAFFLINIPVIKNMVIKINCARFARIYSSLLKSGVPVVESLKILSNTITNYYYQDAFLDAIINIKKGINLSKVTQKKPKIFPILFTQMIQLGEEIGKTDSVLLKLAQFYEAEISQISKNISSIVEPVLMIVIGSAVGFFAVSMLQPMYSLMDNIK